MKQVLAIVAALALAGIAYWLHCEQVEKEVAAARDEALRAVQPTPPRPPLPPGRSVILSQLVEVYYQSLFSALDTQSPKDWAATIKTSRERVLDRKVHVEPVKGPAYDAAATLLAELGRVADQRTQALETMLNQQSRHSSLDQKGSAAGAASTTGDFFASTTAKAWQEYVRRERPVVDQLFSYLRTQERSVNAHLSELPEDYSGLGATDAPAVISSAVPYTNPLERGAYGERRAMLPQPTPYPLYPTQ